MSDEEQPDPHCAICRRRLLPGERAIDFVTATGEKVAVCELCKPRAEASEWLRPDEYERMRIAKPARERRRGRGGAFGGLLSRLGPAPEASRGRAAAQEQATGPGEPARAPATIDPEPTRAEPPVVVTTTGIPEALHAFNHSDHRRTIAGLTRTLGAPRATADEIENGAGLPAVRLTVAWELTWYQWEVGPGERPHEVRESSRGDTIDQLGEADRAWNLMVDVDGTLQQKTAAATDEE
jgi:hypothetical protein